MTKVMERVKSEIDELLIALGKANVLLSNSIIRPVLIKTILSISEILIKDDNQDLPDCPYSYKSWTQYEETIYKEAQQRMKDEHWVKVLKKERQDAENKV